MHSMALSRALRIAMILAAIAASSAPALAVQQVRTVAGSLAGHAGDGGLAVDALLNNPQGIGFDGAGNLYISDNQNFVIRKVDAATGIITTVAGNGISGFGGDGGPATAANLSSPVGISVDPTGNILIADQSNHRIRRVDAATGIIETVAGNGSNGFSGDGGLATLAKINLPQGVATDLAGNIYIADSNNFRIRLVSAANGTIGTIAGNGVPITAGDGGPASGATFTSPRRIAVDFAGNIFILDRATASRIRKIDATTGIITTVAGGGALTGDSGPATQMNLGILTDVAVDGGGGFVTTSGVRAYAVQNDTCTAIAGTGAQGFSGDGGAPLLATFNNISGVAIDGQGEIYVSDRSNHRIRALGLSEQQIIDLTITASTLQSVLDGIVSLQGILSMTDVAGRTDLIMGLLESIGLDFIVTGNGDLVLLETPGLLSIGGILQVQNNVVLNQISLPALTIVGGNLTMTGNASAASVYLANLVNVGGSLSIQGNGTGAPPFAKSRNPVPSIDLGSLATVTGSLNVTGNHPDAIVNLAALTTVNGALTLETKVLGTLDFSNVSVTGNIDITAKGADSVRVRTPGGGGTTAVRIVRDDAELSAALPADTFLDFVTVTVARLDPGSLPVVGALDTLGQPISIDPVAAYHLDANESTPSEDVTLSLEVNVGGLPAPEQAAFLAAVETGQVMLAVRDDSVNAVYRAFVTCPAEVPPAVDGCAALALLDPDHVPVLPGNAPAFVRFTALVRHFSTYAVAIDMSASGAGEFGGTPRAFALLQNAPNPFEGGTAIRYELPRPGRVRITIHDASGRRVRRLVDAILPSGRRETFWDGLGDNGARRSSGVYFFRLETADGTLSRRIVRLR